MKMKKIILFVAALLLTTGAAQSQVRIGGNGEPNPAAILDLNADNNATGSKGLALPRVSLGDVSTALTGSPTVDGMLVYNINASVTGGSGAGIYYWVTNKWIKLDIDDGGSALNVVKDLNADYTVKATDDVLLFKATAVRNITLPTTGVAVGKKLYITDMDGGQGVSITNTSALYNGSYNNVNGGTSETYMYVGDGIWICISGY